MSRPLFGMALATGLAGVQAGCLAPECAHGNYFAAECRVAAEYHYARLITSAGLELRFVDPTTRSADAPVAPLGLFQEREGGRISARPAGLGDFVMVVDGSAVGESGELTLELDNVAADTRVWVGSTDLTEVVPPPLTGLSRTLVLPIGPDPILVVGERTCPDAYRLAAAGDIQTNPLQFERIVEALHDEAASAEEASEPLLGLLLLGDLAESATEDEFRRIREILRSSPVPVATTAGNHDIIGDELAIYNRLFGPGNYAFVACRTHVAMFDSANGTLAPSIEGRLPDFVEHDDDLSFVAGTHYPAFAGRTGAGWSDEGQAWVLLAELARTSVDVLLTGHVHAWRESSVQVGDQTVDQIITGTAGASQGAGQPHFGFTRLTMSGEPDDSPRVDTCFVEVPEPGRAPGDPGAGSGPLRRCASE